MTFIDRFDTGEPGAQYDVGLQWDVNVGPNPGNVQPYLDLITSEHNQRPKFMAMVQAVMQAYADIIAVMMTIPALFDLDDAVGVQLDVIGEWVGVTRNVKVPITGVFFSWDVVGLGWAEGSWADSSSPSELVVLPDAAYRTLLRARIAANHWDGTIPGVYEVWDTMFAGTGFGILIQDEGHMHMIMALTGPVPDAVTLALFEGGYLNLKPAGVRISKYYTPAIPSTPYFGWGVENSSISGWGVGAWGVTSAGQ